MQTCTKPAEPGPSGSLNNNSMTDRRQMLACAILHKSTILIILGGHCSPLDVKDYLYWVIVAQACIRYVGQILAPISRYRVCTVSIGRGSVDSVSGTQVASVVCTAGAIRVIHLHKPL